MGNRNIRLIWGINVGTLKYLKSDWSNTKKYAWDLNAFVGFKCFIVKVFSLDVSGVWNPYICGRERWDNHLFSSDNNLYGYNASLLAIVGVDINAKWKVWEGSSQGLSIGVGYSLRHSFAQSSWNGKAGVFNDWNINADTNANNTFRFLIGYSIDFGSKEKFLSIC